MSRVARVAWTVLALVAVCVGALVYQVYRFGTPPDVAATARSAAVERAARRAADVVDPNLGAAVGAAPWLSPVAAGLEDVCQTGRRYFGSYTGISCTRAATLVLGADGEVAGPYAEWDRALRAIGWYGAADAVTSAAPSPPQRVDYRHGNGLLLLVTWLDPQDGLRGHRAPPYERDPHTDVHRDRRTIDETALRDAAARFRHLVAVTVSLRYYDGDASPSPTPSPWSGGCRDTDSARCPGG